jgi:hypothetical protein
MTIPDGEQACLGIVSMLRSMEITSGHCLGQWGEPFEIIPAVRIVNQSINQSMKKVPNFWIDKERVLTKVKDS